MKKRKFYITPHSEVVFVCKNICEGEHPTKMSKWTNGWGEGGGISEGGGDGDAKEYGWDLWDNYNFDEE